MTNPNHILVVIIWLITVCVVIGIYAILSPSRTVKLAVSLVITILFGSIQAQMLHLYTPDDPWLKSGWVGVGAGMLNLLIITAFMTRDYSRLFNKTTEKFDIPRLGNFVKPTGNFETTVDNPPAFTSKLLRGKAVSQADQHNVAPKPEDRGWMHVEQ